MGKGKDDQTGQSSSLLHFKVTPKNTSGTTCESWVIGSITSPPRVTFHFLIHAPDGCFKMRWNSKGVILEKLDIDPVISLIPF